MSRFTKPGRPKKGTPFLEIIEDIIPIREMKRKSLSERRPSKKSGFYSMIRGIPEVKFMSPVYVEKHPLKGKQQSEYKSGFKELELFGKRTGHFIDRDILSA